MVMLILLHFSRLFVGGKWEVWSRNRGK